LPSGSFSKSLSKNQALELARILGGVTGLIVIEVEIDALQICVPGFNLFRPITQARFGVVTLIGFLAGAVQTHITKVGGNFEWRLEAGNFENAQRSIVMA